MYYIAPGVLISGKVTFGEDASVWHNAVLRGDKASISIGSRTNIQDLCVVHVSEDAEVVIGDDSVIGHGCILHGCTIGSGVLIGMGSILMDHCVIGDGSIVGAGSLILENTVIPPGSLVLGSPGKVLREVTQGQIAATRELAHEYVADARQALKAEEPIR